MLSEHTSINLLPKPYEIDETTDIAAIKEMCIITRYYNDETSKVESRFLGLIEVPQANAETLFQSLTNRFEQFMFPLPI